MFASEVYQDPRILLSSDDLAHVPPATLYMVNLGDDFRRVMAPMCSCEAKPE